MQKTSVVRPTREGQMTRFFRWLTLTHAMRWRVAHRSVGDGHLYRGRFKAFPVQDGPPLLDVLRYVERNAMPARLVRRAETGAGGASGAETMAAMSCGRSCPTGRWIGPLIGVNRVNTPIHPKELARLELSEQRDQPYGDETWTKRTIKKLGLEHTIRREGRPKKESDAKN